MGTFVLAHASDLHLEVPWGLAAAWPPRRMAMALHHLALRRGAHALACAEALVDALAAARADHVVITGDLGILGLEAERARAHALLRPLVEQPGLVTLLAGNHDVVAPGDAAAFAAAFGDLAAGDVDLALPGPFPFVRRRGEVALVGVDSAVGEVGDAQRAALARALEHPAAREAALRVLVVHHGLHGERGGRDVRLRRLADDRALVLAALAGGVDLALHGHVHAPYAWVVERAGRRLVTACAGSATLVRGPSAARAGFNVYTIEDGRLTSITRRRFTPATGRFDVEEALSVGQARWP